MKKITNMQTINRFSAISTSFGNVFASQPIPRRNNSLNLSTIFSNQLPSDENDWLESLLEIWHQGAIVFNEDGETIQTTEFTERMLGKYSLRSEENGISVNLANWMDTYEFSNEDADVEMPPEPLILEVNGDELRIRLIVDNKARRKTLLFKEITQIKPSDIMLLGLTKRESEVLFLIAKGKTNPEIGMLLDISTRTVQKHVEHIYIKLGVETRTAAMLRVNELAPSIDTDGFYVDAMTGTN